MRTSEQLYHRVRWDPRFDPARFVLGLTMRGAPPKRVPLPAFVPGGDIPWHRVAFVEADGELVWDRATGLDRLDDGSAGRVVGERRLRAPFFAAGRPHAWDPTAGTWQPIPDGGPDRTPPAGPVRVLTWNTLWDRYDPDRIHTARRRPLLLAELAAADADVIALQEVEPPLVDLLLAQPWVRAAYATDVDPTAGTLADTGLLLLSRLPVTESGRHALGRFKGLAAITLQTAAGPLVVATTHLTSDHTTDGAARRRRELAAIGDALAGVPGDLVLLGDLNDGTGLPASALRLRDAWTELHGPDDHTPTFDPVANPLAAVSSLTGRPGRLDRVLLRGDGLVAMAAGLRGDGPAELLPSDHYAVRVDLAIGSADPAVAGTCDLPPTARTALAWLPPADLLPAVQELRRRHDPSYDRWPAHVNLLFGFVPEAHFDRAVELLADRLREVEPFGTRLAGVGVFAHQRDGTVWLDPAAADPQPWQRLHAALRALFPGCAAAGRPEYVPHLTLGRAADPEALAAACRAALPGGGALVGELALLSRRGDGPMRVRATVALGSGAPGSGAVRWIDEPAPPAARPVPESRVAEVVRALRTALGTVEVVGSRRTGCALPDADLDLVAALPGDPATDAVTEAVRAALPDARDLITVTGARVPGLRLRVPSPGGDLAVDLTTVATGDLDPARAVARRAELGGPAAIALGAVDDAGALLAAVGDRAPAFAGLARAVKAWARARGLDSAPHGGLPGLAWAVLAARTVLEPGTVGAAPDALLHTFFGSWAAADWGQPVALPGAPDVPDELPGSAALTVLTPGAPIRSCTEQVTPGFRDLLGEELYRAWELTGDGAPTQVLAAAPPLHRRHVAWAVVDVPAGLVGRLRGRTLALLTALDAAGVTDAHAWPHPIDAEPATGPGTGSGSGTGTGTGRVRFAVGLGRTPPDTDRLAAVTRGWTAGLAGTRVERVAGGEVVIAVCGT